MSHPIFELLLQSNKLTTEDVGQLSEQLVATGATAPEVLVASGSIASDELTQFLCQFFDIPSVDIAQYDYAATCQKLGLRELITRHLALPLSVEHDRLKLAIADPTNQQAEDDFRFSTGSAVEVVLCDVLELQAAIRRLYGRALKGAQSNNGTKEINRDELASLVSVSDDEIENIEDLSQDESPVSRFINQILLDAVRKGASDIHFEPYEESYRVRLRCDGILIETEQPPTQLSRRLSARIKILSKLDIAERRLPQDGRIKLRLNAETAIDMRVSTLPTLFGEKIVLRLLDSSSASLDIDKLGYNEQQKALYLSALKKPQGMILMTGPTGSGKTVSLYTGLSIVNRAEINISTAEDPVEINLPGINQVQVQPKIGFTFAAALRAFLRQDPDVIMVGEIRDGETAEIAVKAAQTGHLVMSTLHTNSAAETVVRLGNMGIETYNLASSLNLIIAQRLARRLCQQCKQPASITPVLEHFGLCAQSQIFKANPLGCPQCNNGYSGRVGIYEVMSFNDALVAAILNRASVYDIEKVAQENGMVTLKQAGIEKLKQGVTSFEELQRVLFI